jgi:malate dehydrogenase (oxaloacetate-decarboxylating)(NADP+)
LRERVDPSAALMQKISSAVRAAPNKRVVFAEGEETSVIRAAWAFKQSELGTPVLLGREDLIRKNAIEAGLDFDALGIEIVNARVSHKNVEYTDWLYARLQRRGYLRRDVQRMINQDRNYFAAAMVALGDADAVVSGTTRNFNMVLREVRRVMDVKDRLIGLSIVLAKGRTLFVADTSIHELPDAQELAEIAIQAAAAVRKLGRTPRVAFLSHSTFGDPPGERGEKVREAIRILDGMDVDFEYEGEMPPELALDPGRPRQLSVHAPVGRRQCTGHAGDPVGLDLDASGPVPGRGDRDRPPAGRAREVGPDRQSRRLGLRDHHRRHLRRLRRRSAGALGSGVCKEDAPVRASVRVRRSCGPGRDRA